RCAAVILPRYPAKRGIVLAADDHRCVQLPRTFDMHAKAGALDLDRRAAGPRDAALRQMPMDLDKMFCAAFQRVPHLESHPLLVEFDAPAMQHGVVQTQVTVVHAFKYVAHCASLKLLASGAGMFQPQEIAA